MATKSELDINPERQVAAALSTQNAFFRTLLGTTHRMSDNTKTSIQRYFIDRLNEIVKPTTMLLDRIINDGGQPKLLAIGHVLLERPDLNTDSSPAFCYCPSAGAAIIGDGEGNVTLYEYYRAKRILTPTTKFQAVSQGNLHLSSGNFYHITAANGEHMQHSAKSFFNVLNEPRNSALLGLTTATVYREGLPQQVTAFRLIKKLWVPSDERLGFKFGRPITRIVFIPE